VSQKFLQDGDYIVDSVQPRGGEVMTQRVNHDRSGHDADSEVGKDVAGDKGQCPEQGRGLKDVANVAHVDELVE
jgi:hypothetical protein